MRLLIPLFTTILIGTNGFTHETGGEPQKDRNHNVFAAACERLLRAGDKASRQFQFLAQAYEDSPESMEEQFHKFLSTFGIAPSDITGIAYVGSISSQGMYEYSFAVDTTRGPHKMKIKNGNFVPAALNNDDGSKNLRPLGNLDRAMAQVAKKAASGEEIRAQSIAKNLKEALLHFGFADSDLARMKYSHSIGDLGLIHAFDLTTVDGRVFTIDVAEIAI